MRTRDYRVLKYVKRHPEVTKKKLYEKYIFLEKDYKYISDFLCIENQDMEVDNGLPTGRWIPVDTSTYILNHAGYEQLEKKQHDTWLFWFPYTITTIIAAVSVAPNFAQIFNFIIGLFSKGSP